MNTSKEPSQPICSSEIACFIDADNYRFKKDKLSLKNLMDALTPWGNVKHKFIFARNFDNDPELIEQIEKEKFHKYIVSGTPKRKNGVDIRLTVAIMELLFSSPHIKGFAIATSDSDFIPLIKRLQQYKKMVIGIGHKTMSLPLKNVCNAFLFYEDLVTIYSVPKRSMIFPITQIKTGEEALRTLLRKKSVYPPAPDMRRKLLPYLAKTNTKLTFPCLYKDLQEEWLELGDSLGISRTIIRNIVHALMRSNTVFQEDVPFQERYIDSLPDAITMENIICHLQLQYICESESIILDPIAISKVIWGNTQKVNEIEKALRKGKINEVSS